MFVNDVRDHNTAALCHGDNGPVHHGMIHIKEGWIFGRTKPLFNGDVTIATASPDQRIYIYTPPTITNGLPSHLMEYTCVCEKDRERR